MMPTKPRSKAATKQRNARGSAKDRRARRVWLLKTFNPGMGDDHALCRLRLSPDCLLVVDINTLSVDRINVGGPYTRDNIQPACGPCQSLQGGKVGCERRGLE